MTDQKGDVSDPLIMQSRRDLGLGANLSTSSPNQPRARCVKSTKRFTIALFLPGVLLKNIYVDTTDLGDRVVTVGGCWNEHIFGIEDVRDDMRSPRNSSVSSPSPGRVTTPQQQSTGAAASPGPAVLADSLPTGSFEMLFEVPLPFERCHWHSDYEAGVLFLHWDAPT